jgi:peptidoglycan/LPS O-acetylase OafA/YrhL
MLAPSKTVRGQNNFGALRLLFAVLVIVSHSSELIDGNRSREFIARTFGNLTFGVIGVYGFFIISGYLITRSFRESHSAGGYLLKRVLRIYPAYIVAYLLCVVALGPLVGGKLASLSATEEFGQIVRLQPPLMPGVFEGTAYPLLNGSMWTIAYEFRCYLLVLFAGMIGLLSHRFVVTLFTVFCLALAAAHPPILDNYVPFAARTVGLPFFDVEFAGVFGCGALFYLYEDRIDYDWRIALLAAVAMFGLMFSSRLAVAAVAILGAYVLFWFAFKVKLPALASIGAHVDISYGLYLYAWPIQMVLIWSTPGISPWLVFLATTAIGSALGLASWQLVESPALRLKSFSRLQIRGTGSA